MPYEAAEGANDLVGVLAVLGELLDRVRSGLGARLLLEGVARMGESRLVAEGETQPWPELTR